MRAKSIIAILAIAGLLVFVAVSVLGGSKDKAASARTALRAPETEANLPVGDGYFVGSPLGTKSVPQQINYQGYLVNSSDTSAVTDTLEMTFKIYAAETGGSELWWETHSEVAVLNGLFNVLLGTPDSLFTGQELWLETTVGGETLSPRKKLISVPYAFKCDCWTSSGDNCYFDKTGNVGIGTTNPGNKLHVVGSESVPLLNVEQSGPFRAVRVYSENACALWVENAGNHGLRVTNAGGDGIHVENAGGWAGYFNGKGYFSDYVMASTGDLLDLEGSVIGHGHGFIPNGQVPIHGVIGIMHCSQYEMPGYGVLGTVDGIGTGVGGKGNTGVYGKGSTYGVYGQAQLPTGGPYPYTVYGVYGEAADVSPPNVSYGVYSDGDAKVDGRLHVNDVIRLKPRSTAPSNPSEGDIYMDSNDNKLKVYDGTQWQSCW
jgi:hypothetical protein